MENKINKTELFKNLYLCLAPTGEKQGMVITDAKGKFESRIGERFEIDASYNLYLVNNSEYDIGKVGILTGAFATVDDDLEELPNYYQEKGKVKSKSAIILEKIDYGLLDFVVWYQIKLDFANGESINLFLNINKGYALKDEIFMDIPVINKKAYNFSFKEKED